MMPRPPTLEELAAEARDGDPDAAFELVKRAPCTGFLPFLKQWVPKGEMTPKTFDVLADAYDRWRAMDDLEELLKEAS